MIFSEATCSHEGRFVRINGDLYRTTSLRGDSFPGEIAFVNVDTTMFKKADFITNQDYTIKFLPFDIEEHGCEYKILIDNGVLNFPKYFIPQNDGQPRQAGVPPSGHIMDFFSTAFKERFGDQREGAYPIYLSADEFGELFFEALDLLLAAGIHESVILTQWCEGASSIYGSIFNRKVYGSVEPTKPDIIQPIRS